MSEDKKIDDTIAFFVELKGQDLIQAIRQIQKGIATLNHQVSSYKTVNARIVLSKVNSPDIRSSELIRFKKAIKKLGGNVKYETRTMTERIN